eukprot:scaffold20690_cov130-Isochrysis_galbana.AAC.4
MSASRGGDEGERGVLGEPGEPSRTDAERTPQNTRTRRRIPPNNAETGFWRFWADTAHALRRMANDAEL